MLFQICASIVAIALTVLILVAAIVLCLMAYDTVCDLVEDIKRGCK